MRKSIPAVVLTLLSGAAGFGLRKWQLSTGFEPGTGLPISNMAAATALMALSAALAVALIALSWGQSEPLSLERTFEGAEGNTLFVTACVLAGFLLLAGGGAEMASLAAGARSPAAADTFMARASAAVLPPLRIALGVGGLPCALLWGQSLFRRSRSARESVFLLELCILFCVWLISDYQLRAADPVTQNYAYEVLAITSSLMGLYYLAGYSFQQGKPRRAAFFCLMGAYFSLVTMADIHSLADLCRYGFSVLFLTAHAALILGEHPAGEEPAAETEAKSNG